MFPSQRDNNQGAERSGLNDQEGPKWVAFLTPQVARDPKTQIFHSVRSSTSVTLIGELEDHLRVMI